MKRLWMPLYIADYLKDTTHLRAMESGAYLHLIMAYWVGGKLPTDDKQLATIAKVSIREWRAMKETIAAFFGPGWTHKRIDEELAKARENAERASARGRAGADARYSKHASSMPQAETEHAPSPTPSPSKKDIRAVASATSPPANEDFGKFWKAYPKRKGANPRAPAEKLFLSAVKSGVDAKQIIEAIANGAGFDREKIGTEFIPQAVKWLRDRRWEEYTPPDAAITAERAEFMAARGYVWADNRWQKTEVKSEAAA